MNQVDLNAYILFNSFKMLFSAILQHKNYILLIYNKNTTMLKSKM